MTTRADVVVVGAGLGGLACAADLAGRGAGVIVLERHGLVGGYASSFTRGSFTFDVSQHSVGGLSEGQSFWQLLDRLGVATALEVVRPARLATMITPDGVLEIPNDRDGCMEVLASTSPGEEPALRKLLETCAAIHRDTVAGALDSDMRRLIRGMRLAGDRTFENVLQESITSPRLRRALASPWVLLGLPPSRASFSWFAKVLATTYVEGAGHIVGGGQALSDAIAARARDLGVEIRTGEGALHICLENGRVASVETQKEEHIETRTVVAGVDPWSLAELLDGEQDLEPVGEPSLSMIAMYMGLGSDPGSLGMAEGTTFIQGSGDAEKAYRHSLQGKVDEADLVLSNPSPLDGGYAPDGKSMVHAVALVNGRPWFDLDASAYVKRKRQATTALMTRLERLYPGIGEAVEVKETATPRTMYGFTRNHIGAVYGLAQTLAQSGSKRPGPSSSIPGLFRTGAWVLPGGGYSAATLSGLLTGREVARHLELEAATPRPSRDEASFHLAIFYEDTDTDGLTYHVSYLRFFDRARTEMFMQLSKERDIPLPRAVVTRIDVTYHHPSTLGDAVRIHTRARFESDFRVVFEQEAVLERDGTTLAEATTDMAFVDPEGNPVPCPVREALEID
ncbi:MAG: FAD-dependent oxidoreductase [Deltaproteobacteria bacterium]|nr:FAD-dependent oxidoreductase [Deltaproteobacteria bacterium]